MPLKREKTYRINGVTMPSQKVKDYYDSLAQRYDEKYENLAMRHMRRIESEVIEHYLNHVESIIDIGCGTGLYALALGKRGYTVLATDISHEMIRRAASKASTLGSEIKITFLQHDIETQLDSKKKFDLAISMFGALNHVESLEKALQNIGDVLSPGGHLIFTIANDLSLRRLRIARKGHRFTDAVQGKYSKTSEFYVREAQKTLWTRYYTRKEVKDILRKCSFHVEKIGGIFLLVKPQYHSDSDNNLSRRLKIFMWLERKTRWLVPASFFSEYLIFVCRRNTS